MCLSSIKPTLIKPTLMALIYKHLFVILLICVTGTVNSLIIYMSATSDTLNQPIRIISWNMKGLSGATPYIRELLNMSDICVVIEHHLYECELHKLHDVCTEFDIYAKSCDLLDNHNVHTIPGYGGVAIMWRSTLSHVITRCSNLGDDRLCIVKLQNAAGNLLFIIAVYLPQQNRYISNF